MRPTDPDVTGDNACTLVDGDTTKFSIPRGCELHVSQTQELRSYALRVVTYPVTGSDGQHNAVTYPVTVELAPYSRDDVAASVVLRLAHNTHAGFLEDSYDARRAATADQLNDGGR